MRILLASDSHGNNEALHIIYDKHPDMDFYLFLGDSESDEFSIRPFVSVQGNNDYYPFQDEIILPTPQGTIYASHRQPFLSEIKSKFRDIKIICFGHTHKRKFEKIGNILYINPGSISFSRDGNDLSYMVLDIDEKGIKYQYFTLN